MRRWLIYLFERHMVTRLYRRRRKAEVAPESEEELRQAVEGLDTVWRAATYVESLIDQELAGSLFDVPKPPERVLQERRGSAADYAHLAQRVLALGGKEALYCSVYDRAMKAREVVCAVKDGGVWHHISQQGMFGMYDSLEEVADDLIPGWALMVTRDVNMGIVSWQDAPRDAGRPDE